MYFTDTITISIPCPFIITVANRQPDTLRAVVAVVFIGV